MNLSKCQGRLPPRTWSIYTPPSHYLPLREKRVPRGLSSMPSRIVHIWIPTVKKREVNGCQRCPLGWADCPPGPHGLSAWASRNVCGQAADRPPGPPELHTVMFGFEVNNGPSSQDPRTVCLEAKFLENLCENTQILNKSQKPTNRPLREPRLSAQHLETDFLWIFNETLLPREIATHLNAKHANSWSKWHCGKWSQWNWPLLIVRLSIISTRSFSIL
jgi:hypothetical protein